jgi:hypothetical protein
LYVFGFIESFYSSRAGAYSSRASPDSFAITTSHAMNIPTTENALLIRTDFSNDHEWGRLTTIVREPADPFMFNMEIVDDRANSSATVDQLMGALPEDYPHSFMVVADTASMSQPDYPLLVVDLLEERGRQFRTVAAQLASIDNNLSIANMGFEEFAGLVDESGVFRGIPGM